VSPDCSFVPDNQLEPPRRPGKETKVPPPGEPPDKGPSWAVAFPNGENGSPWISVAEDVREALAAPLEMFFGHQTAWENDLKLKQLWSPSGGMVMSNLPNKYFLVRFKKESDLEGALSAGPWTIFGHYMMLKRGHRL
ncbi:hypothetical protein V2J09_015530, partial [Rumex salicifolius]